LLGKRRFGRKFFSGRARPIYIYRGNSCKKEKKKGKKERKKKN
jgi:hypothetical protein